MVGTIPPLTGATQRDAQQGWTFDAVSGGYISTYDGHSLSQSELRDAVEVVIAGAKAMATRYTADFVRGRYTLTEYRALLRGLIEALHGAAAAAGTANMSPLLAAAEADLQATLSRERGFLAAFMAALSGAMAAAITTAEVLVILQSREAAIARQAASYMDAARVTFERDRGALMRFLDFTEAARELRPGGEHCKGCEEQAARGYVPLEELVPLGEEECGQWCECRITYRRAAIHAVPEEGETQREQAK